MTQGSASVWMSTPGSASQVHPCTPSMVSPNRTRASLNTYSTIQLSERLRGGCFGNPHSDSLASGASSRLVDQAREAILRYFNACPDEYAVIFTQNATGAYRLGGEAHQFRPWLRLVLTADNHSSMTTASSGSSTAALART